MARVLFRGARGLRFAATAALVGFVLHAALPDRGRIEWVFDYPVYYGIVWVAVVLVVLRVLLVPVHRAGWAAIAIAMASYGTAELIWILAYSNADNVPYPSWADVFYLSFYPASWIGVVLLFRARARGVAAGIWLDGLTALLTAGAVGAAVLAQVVLAGTDGELATVATNLAYPLGDIVLLALLIGGFAITRWRPGRAWLLIGAALGVFALGDSIYLVQTANGTYVEGTLLDVAWPAALLAMAWAAWADRGGGEKVDVTGRALLAVPVVASAIAVGVLLLDRVHPVNLLAAMLATGALAAGLGRLAFTLRENRRLFQQAREESVTDPITGLGNRRRLVRDLESAARAATPATPWLLLIFDLDGFKGYNDAFGHPAGDQLLAHLGAKLLATDGTGVSVYRLGGDEFCLLAPVAETDVGQLVDDAAGALAESGEGFEVTSSFGAVVMPDDATDASEALRLADARLYAQKHGKRARRDQPHVPLVQALFEREPRLHLHTEEVAALADAVGRELGLPATELEELHRAAMLHDIGKLAIPDAILHKAGPLSEEEWEFMRRHTLIGERILLGSPLLRSVSRIVRATHEHWDGSGYPDGLAGDAIPLPARIVAVCDAWHALTNDRPYRSAASTDAARAELQERAGTQFDPAVVAALEVVLRAQPAGVPA
jgi:diguanylate cyclase (GGDEF)-like protein